MTIAEFIALDTDERNDKSEEMATFWMKVKGLNQSRESANTSQEKAFILGQFNDLLSNTELVS